MPGSGSGLVLVDGFIRDPSTITEHELDLSRLYLDIHFYPFRFACQIALIRKMMTQPRSRPQFGL